MDILGIRVDNLDKKEILNKIEKFLAGDELCQIATINPEFILEAQKDEKFKNILNNCDLNIADGIGIKFAFWRRGFQKLKCRMAGADLAREILKMANDRGAGIFLAANKEGLSTWEETAQAIKKIYPSMKVGGGDLDKNNPIYELQITNYDIIFCNFGHPYQEKFIYSLKQSNYGLPQHLLKGTTNNNMMCYNNNVSPIKRELREKRCGGKINLAMGVGGSFEFWTGKIHRAPKIMRLLGLEWLFRLVKQPNRFCRIFNAVIIFPIRVIFNK